MEIIAADTDPIIARMLDGYDHPAILVTPDYRILATNDRYRDLFGEIDSNADTAYCYRVSHGYDRPCDQAGENCPLAAARASGRAQRALHVHQTPRGEEHVDIEMLPIKGATGELRYFVELLKPIPLAGESVNDKPMVGASKVFNAMLALLSRVAPSDAAVLLLGESGTGKELAARTLHRASRRAAGALVTLECAGLSETLFESELFGHVKGAFTGANYRRQGLAEAAHGGTLFLDEVGDIPLPLQVKLLRLIETGTFRPVGSTETRHADFRLVCATHKDLDQMVAAGQFRRDLYYRINVFPVRLPPLAERLEDLPLLARAILEGQPGERNWHMTESAMALLRQHDYRGNIRELRNILARAVIFADTNVIDLDVIQQSLSATARGQYEPPEGVIGGGPVEMDLKTLDRAYLQQLMQRHNHDRQRVARIAGISVRSLYRKLQES